MAEPEEAEPPKKRKKNQYLPTPPDDDLKPLISYYWHLGLTDQAVTDHCIDHFDKTQYGLSLWTVKRRRKEMGLLGTRQTAASWEVIEPFYQQIRARFPTMGARQMVTMIRQDHSIKVSEHFLAQFLNAVERDLVEKRKHKKFRRKKYYCVGVNDVWAFDQHDKWKRHGLWLHVCIEPFSGRILWLKIWWTNRNPKLITSYYIESGRKIGGIPMITQSDPGSENYGIANCHTVTRQRLDPSLEGTLQHKWMNGHGANVKPEICWSLLRHQWTPGFETILDVGVNSGFYDATNPLEKLVFRWLAIPWLQKELDAWVQRFNTSQRRADKHKILPRGIPDLIAAKPQSYGSQDYKVGISAELFDEMEQKWAPPSDPVFDLVPPAFGIQASSLYTQLNSPAVTSSTFWEVYLQLLDAFKAIPIEDALKAQMEAADDHFEFEIELLANQKELRNGANVVSGLFQADDEATQPEPARQYADFTTSEEEED